ncbi:MAG: sigma-54-dependent Fis family transcriptional regulator, partial [Calditrichales bacterium]
MIKRKILIVDDDEKVLFAFREVLEKDGHQYMDARSGREAIEKTAANKPDLVIMDINLPEMDGLEALQKIKETNQFMPVIIITGEGTMQTAIQAMRYGAFQYLMKPVSVATIRQEIDRAIISSKASVPAKNDQYSEEAGRYMLIGNSIDMQNIYKTIGQVCTTPNQTNVLITGETGTGKELVARAIHRNSTHHNEPFIAVNCTALPETLLESELFGHEKGAFTGAVNQKKGKLELAGEGTIFLDEIGDLNPE